MASQFWVMVSELLELSALVSYLSTDVTRYQLDQRYSILIFNDQLDSQLKLFHQATSQTPLFFMGDAYWELCGTTAQSIFQVTFWAANAFYWLIMLHCSQEQIHPHTHIPDSWYTIQKVNVFSPRFLKQMSGGFHCSLNLSLQYTNPTCTSLLIFLLILNHQSLWMKLNKAIRNMGTGILHQEH